MEKYDIVTETQKELYKGKIVRVLKYKIIGDGYDSGWIDTYNEMVKLYNKLNN